MDDYFLGADVLGTSDQYLTIRVKNPGDLVKAQGGAAGALAYRAAPQTIEDKIYDEMASQMRVQFKDKGVDADIQVKSGLPFGASPPRNDFWRGAGLAAGSLGGVGLVVWGVRALFRRRG